MFDPIIGNDRRLFALGVLFGRIHVRLDLCRILRFPQWLWRNAWNFVTDDDRNGQAKCNSNNKFHKRIYGREVIILSLD